MSITLPPIKWQPTKNQSDRTESVRLVVVHRPVGPYAAAIATLCDPKREASAHIVLGRPDEKGALEATQLVGWSKKAWACMAFNSASDNLEIRDEAWNGKDTEAWKVAARITAFRLKKRGLPPAWRRNGQGRGFCRHYDLSIAGGGHTDPTTSTWAWLKFVARVKWEYHRGGFAKEWGRD